MRSRSPDLRTLPSSTVADVELAPDVAQVDVLALERERRRARRDLERLEARQRVQELLGDAVGEVFLLRIVAHVDEGQHRDRAARAVGRRRSRPRPTRRRTATPRTALVPDEPVECEQRHRHREHADDQEIQPPSGVVASSTHRAARRRVRFSPCGVSSKAQANTSASGSPRITSVVTTFEYPCRCTEHREQHRGDLDGHPAGSTVGNADPDDIAPLQLGPEPAHSTSASGACCRVCFRTSSSREGLIGRPHATTVRPASGRCRSIAARGSDVAPGVARQRRAGTGVG